MGRGVAVGLSVVAACLVLAAGASAQPMPAPWDGSNPFNCVNQDVGTGVDFPDPGADPFCVEFDKTQQNVTDLGIVDFLLNEPARVAAAVPKCFYFQSDHWTGSLVQGESPEFWHWDGAYFFDKAKGMGGVGLHNLRILGQSTDITQFVPESFKAYVYPGGGGGGMLVNDIPADPACAAMVDTPEEAAQVYASAGSPPIGPALGPPVGADQVPPQTKITSGPRTKSGRITFGFSASENATFRCRLDGRRFRACVSPKSYGRVSGGGHTFRVKAVDAAGNVDPTPAKRRFTVAP